MPGQLEFPKLIIVTPYSRPGFPVDSPILCVDTVQSFSLITGDGDIVATLSIGHTRCKACAMLVYKYDDLAYEVDVPKEVLMRDKNMLEVAVTDMLLRCGMKFFTLRDEICATSSAIASLV